MKYKVIIPIFLLLFVIVSVSELIFAFIFYDNILYLRTFIFGAIGGGLMTYILFKKGNIEKISDALKYKKIEISVNEKCTIKTVYLIMETLKLNHYIINKKRTNPDIIHIKTKFSLLDFGDIYTIKFLATKIVLKSRPRIAVNIIDTNNITSQRIAQVEKIIKIQYEAYIKRK